MDSKAFIEGLKELGRVVILAIVSFALTEGVLGIILAKFGVATDPEIRLIIIGFLTSALSRLKMKSINPLSKEICLRKD